MSTVTWTGVMPAITTPFTDDGEVDHTFLASHVSWLVDNGCTAIVPLGSLGEGATLTGDEKRAILETCVGAIGDRVPVIPGISSAATRDAVRLARDAERLGCRGLMVLPPYLHAGPWAEAKAHFDAVFDATGLDTMLYNNPVAYSTDVLPADIEAFAARHPRLRAVKESSGNVRRITEITARAGDRLAVFVGFDDIIVEGVRAGAVGWIAGLVNAMPKESVLLHELARSGDDAVDALYRWFLPLLRLDTVPEFVQLIKLVQSEVGQGSERVRLPRQPATGELRASALDVIRTALATRPA